MSAVSDAQNAQRRSLFVRFRAVIVFVFIVMIGTAISEIVIVISQPVEIKIDVDVDNYYALVLCCMRAHCGRACS